jgi:2-amino-4-hydroxy-6-hydroxymethyldihydropteridine diphosphokinase
MILIGLGANLPDERYGPPRATLEAALAALSREGVRVVGISRWYESVPVPASDQPNYVNAVARIETALGPEPLLELLHAIEAAFGRERSVANAARTIDLDLLDWNGEVRSGRPVLPHPRMSVRAFVLRPLADVAPGWRHPVSGDRVEDLLARAPDRADVHPLDPD